MKSTFLLFIRICIVWLLFFTVQRLFFLIHYWSDFDVDFLTLLKLPIEAFRLDLSGFAYFNGIPFVFLVLSLLSFTPKWQIIFVKLTKISVWFFAVISSIIFSSELTSYYEWRSKLSSKIFIHFETPDEIFRTSSGTYTWWFLLYVVLQLIVFYFLYRWLIKSKTIQEIKQKLMLKLGYFLSFFVVGCTFLGLALRGGWQEIPISATNAYYTNSQITNDLSVNSVWNFIHMTYEHFNTDYAQYYKNVPESEANQILKNLYQVDLEVDTLNIFKTKQPNIIFVTLEGWSADMIEPLGGLKGITPHFNQLTKEGLLFTQIYATSETSETGHTSIYSGYLTLPKVAMSTESAKCRKMPSIIHALGNNYESSYYFGGDLAYGNIGGYMNEIGWKRLTDENDLDLQPKGNLGIHDEAMFPYYYSEIKKANRPYIYGLFTQSTHSPYDMEWPFLEDYPTDDYTRSMNYADVQIKKFTDSLKLLPDFDNTIVVFIADHGKTNFVNNNRYTDGYYHIPALFWGGALVDSIKGKQINKIGSQVDIVKTLLTQLDVNTKQFKWSKDLLNPSTKEWAVITTSYTYGIKTPKGTVIYQFIDDAIVFDTFENSEESKQWLKKCQAIIESVFREYERL